MRVLRLILILFVLILGVSFAVMNDLQVTIHYFVGIATLPLSLLIVFSIVVGVILGLLTSASVYFRVKRQHNELRKQLVALQAEIAQLRTERI